jgi:hypothetical protein
VYALASVSSVSVCVGIRQRMEAQQRDCLLVALCFYSALSKTRDLGQEKSFFTLLEFAFSSVFFCSFGSPEEFFFFCFFVLFFVLFFFRIFWG